MKSRPLIIFSLLVPFFLAACKSGSTRENPGSQNDIPTLEESDTSSSGAASTKASGLEVESVEERKFEKYELTEENRCSTFSRTSQTQEELCLNVQVETQNNSCAQDKRKEFFDKKCQNLKSISWNPESALKSLESQRKMSLVCSLELGAAAKSEKGYVIEQTLFVDQLILDNEGKRALIKKRESNADALIEVTLVDLSEKKVLKKQDYRIKFDEENAKIELAVDEVMVLRCVRNLLLSFSAKEQEKKSVSGSQSSSSGPLDFGKLFQD